MNEPLLKVDNNKNFINIFSMIEEVINFFC